jgi:uncharacterized protein YciI
VPDILEKRGPYREAHLAGARKHLDAGRLVAAGAVGDPVEGATFFFKDISKVCGVCVVCLGGRGSRVEVREQQGSVTGGPRLVYREVCQGGICVWVCQHNSSCIRWLASYELPPHIGCAHQSRGPLLESRALLCSAVLHPAVPTLLLLQEDIEAFVASDPYVQNGLVPSWSLKPFAVVVGNP